MLFAKMLQLNKFCSKLQRFLEVASNLFLNFLVLLKVELVIWHSYATIRTFQKLYVSNIFQFRKW